MKKFRFSSKSHDKTDPAKFSHISIPQKDPIAIIPPKKVIKALYDYQVQDPDRNPGYLSFAQGDFLHVVGREDDTDWYDACNPLHNTRGLVPVNYFTLVDKRVRTSDNDPLLNSQANGSHPGQAPHDSGQMQVDNPNGAVSRKSSGGGKAQSMVYGIVLFDFKAERPDELDATAGEAIIVIAQSNPEWFVAKPITRLGGPGLIPVSFIQLRDTTTGRPVEDTEQAVKNAGVPSVEEWKRMAAEYKNSSVSLGKLNFGNAQPMQQGPDRLSVNSSRRSQDTSRYGGEIRQHERTSSAYTQAQYYSQQNTRSMQLMSPVRARVAGYQQREGDFIFNVQALMEDGRAWNLQRSYKDFYGLQLHLIEQFPEAAGRTQGISRTLPLMPGPLPWVTEKLTNDRCLHLNVYLHKLLQMPTITQSHVVRGFFCPKDGDAEIQPPAELMEAYRVPEVPDPRLSDASQQSGPFPDSRQSSNGNLNGGIVYGSPQKNAQLQQQQPQYRSNSPQGQQQQPTSHFRSPSELRAMNGNSMPPPMLRNNSAMTSASANSANSQQLGGPGGAAAVKIKVWFGDQNCVVIRLPMTFSYVDLVNKLRERWSLEPGVDKANAQDVGFDIEYKDEATQAFYRILGDEELAVARERNEKLTLRVNAQSGMM